MPTVDKEKAVRAIIESAIKNFASGMTVDYLKDVDNSNGVINSKKNNIFISTLGEEFIFYSAFSRSFDSRFGKVLENIGTSIAGLIYNVKKDVSGYIFPAHETKITELINAYSDKNNSTKPERSHYVNLDFFPPNNKESFRRTHVSDGYYYDEKLNIHYLIELKAGGDLDNKKAPAEKKALLEQYFILESKLREEGNNKPVIKIFFATAYNKNGEGNKWKQASVRNFFSEDELLIGKDFWNFVYSGDDGFDIIIDQYSKSSQHILDAVREIKNAYALEV